MKNILPPSLAPKSQPKGLPSFSCCLLPIQTMLTNYGLSPVALTIWAGENLKSNIGKAGSILITDLIQGCYNVSVFVNDPKKPTKSFGYGCINNPDLWTFEIYRDFVKFIGP